MDTQRIHNERPRGGEEMNRPLINSAQGQYSHEILIDVMRDSYLG